MGDRYKTLCYIEYVLMFCLHVMYHFVPNAPGTLTSTSGFHVYVHMYKKKRGGGDRTFCQHV